jgi:sugar phosphate isomerase/epimerase
MEQTSMEEDLQICTDLGIRGLGIDEKKMEHGQDQELARELAQRGITPSICSPSVITMLPSPTIPGPETAEGRIDAICQSIHRLAAIGGQIVFAASGPLGDYSEADARATVVDGMRRAVDAAREAGVIFAIEPMTKRTNPDMGHIREWSFISLTEVGSLIEDVGDELKIVYDLWHLWDTSDVLTLTRACASSVAGVQLNDYHQPPRLPMDRLLPGQGVIDIPAILDVLEQGGFDGWYDLEVFSDLSLPDSIWASPPREWIEQGRQGFLRALSAARQERRA